MGIIAIATYKPVEGKEGEFLNLLKNHIPTLRKEGLVSDNESLSMQSENGTILEIFEWVSLEAKGKAHESEAVMNIWSRFEGLADIVSLDTLEETKRPFAAFEVIGF